VTGTWIRDDEATDSNYWGKQMSVVVNSTEALAALLKENDGILLEIGSSAS